jgi:3-oxoacyl-[acyl-carrier protein] reductase
MVLRIWRKLWHGWRLFKRKAAKMTSRGRFGGKVAFVTGGSSGIGAAIVRRLASEGARVAFTYIGSDERAAEVAKAAHALAIPADSTDTEALVAAIDEAVRKFGSLDILVNHAGMSVMGFISQIPMSDVDRMLALNVRAVVVATQTAVRRMNDGGRIIITGSSSAERLPFAGTSVYGMTKAALKGFVKGAARDLGSRRITVNNIQPGPTDTEANPADAPEAGLLKEETALGRFATPEEIAGLVAYLASDEARYITGASFTIDGGFTA